MQLHAYQMYADNLSLLQQLYLIDRIQVYLKFNIQILFTTSC